MATTIAKLNIHFGADGTGVSKTIQTIQADLSGMESKFSGLASRITQAAAGIGLAAAGFAGWGLKLSAENEQATTSFSVLLGSASKAKNMIASIQAVADRSPYGAAGLRDAAQTMLAFGVEGSRILPMLNMLGDVAAGNEQRMSSLALVFGQVAANARLTGQDLLQFVNAGFNPLQEISRRTGESMAELRKRMEAGGISAKEVEQAFIDATSSGGRFAGMMDKTSQTLSGRFSTLQDSVAGLARSIGDVLAPTAGKWLDTASGNVAMLKSLDMETVSVIATNAALVAGFAAGLYLFPKIISGVSLLIQAYKALTTTSIILQALSGPRGWAALAVGVAVAAVAATAVNQQFADLTKNFNEATANAKKNAEEAKSIVEGVGNTAQGAAGGIASAIANAVDSTGGLSDELQAVKDQLDDTKRKYDSIRDSMNRGTQLSGAADRFTAEGFNVVAQGQAQQAVVSALEKLRQQEANDTAKLEARIRDLERAIKANKINVKESGVI